MEGLRRSRDPIASLIYRLPRTAQIAIVISGAILVHLALGTVYTFGNMLPYIASYLRAHVDSGIEPSQLSWIFALQGMLQCFTMPFAGWVEARIGPRNTVFIGALIMSGGILVSHWTIQTSIALIFLTYGAMFGLGIGFSYNACLICAMRWLPKYRGVANGLVLLGFGCGAFIFNPIQTSFINPQNLPANCKDGKNTYFCQESLLERVPKVFFVLASSYFAMQIIGALVLVNPPPKEKDEDQLVEDEEEAEEPFVEPKVAVKSVTLWLLWATFFCNTQSIFFISVFFKTFGEKFISDDLFLAFVGSIASIFNSVGRVFWGFLGDKFSFQVAMSILTSCLCLLMATTLWTEIGGRYAFLIWICAIFFTFSGCFSLFPSATAKCFGGKYVGINYGIVMTSVAAANLIGQILSQSLLNRINFSGMFFLMAGFAFLGFIFTASIHLTKFGKGVSQALLREQLKRTEVNQSFGIY